RSALCPYATLFRSLVAAGQESGAAVGIVLADGDRPVAQGALAVRVPADLDDDLPVAVVADDLRAQRVDVAHLRHGRAHGRDLGEALDDEAGAGADAVGIASDVVEHLGRTLPAARGLVRGQEIDLLAEGHGGDEESGVEAVQLGRRVDPAQPWFAQVRAQPQVAVAQNL